MAGTMVAMCQAFEFAAVSQMMRNSLQTRTTSRRSCTSCLFMMQRKQSFVRKCATPVSATTRPGLFVNISDNRYPTIRQYHLIGDIAFTSRRQPTLLARYATGSGDSESEVSNDEEAAAAAEGGNDNEITPTWTYTPYKPPPPNGRGGRDGRGGGGRGQQRQRRRFSSNSEWRVPNRITIPEDRLEVSFVRSSGAGGQNVNKVNTKVEMRFLLRDASWIPAEVRTRIRQNEANRINKDGYLTVTSQEHRTQAQNRKDAIKKLEDIILRSYPRPKVRKMRKGVSKKAKEIKKENKKRMSQKKANRRSVDF